MLYQMILLCCFLGFCSTHAALEESHPSSSASSQILPQTMLWMQSFNQYVANDIGYKYFTDLILTNQGSFHNPHFEEVSVCSLFSKLRCATCFAMAISTNVREDVFATVLEACHISEVYQVFVAVDSYYKGLANSDKFQQLQSLIFKNTQGPAKELHASGALLSRHKWLIKKVHDCQSNIFLQQFPWLEEWVCSRKRLSSFFKNTLKATSPNTVFSDLIKLCESAPYALHHLEKSDFKQYAHTLIPSLCNEDALFTFSIMVQKSLPFDPHKEELLDIILHISPALSSPDPHELQNHSTLLKEAIFVIFRSLHTHITKEQWSHCLSLLRKQLSWVNDAYKEHHAWSTTVFAHQDLPSKPTTATPYVDYYTRYHAPYIFKRHATAVSDTCQLLQKYCGQEDRRTCTIWQKRAKNDNHLGTYCLRNRSSFLTKLLTLRCCILWNLAKKDKPTSHFYRLYSTCTLAEKRALFLNAERTQNAELPYKKKLTDIKLPNPTEDLSRLALAAFICPKASQ